MTRWIIYSTAEATISHLLHRKWKDVSFTLDNMTIKMVYSVEYATTHNLFYSMQPISSSTL